MGYIELQQPQDLLGNIVLVAAIVIAFPVVVFLGVRVLRLVLARRGPDTDAS